MRFSELFNNATADIKKLSNLGAVTFGKGVTAKNDSRTPHYEINECLTMYEQNGIVASAVNQLVGFIIPNKEVKLQSKDKKSVKFMIEWHKQRKDILEEMKNILTTNIICGNGGEEKHYSKTTDGKDVLDNIFANNDMNRIYVNPDDVDGEMAYVFELPVGIKSFKYMGETQEPKYYPVKYVKNYSWYMKQVYGITVPGWKMAIFKTGWSRDNLYGRSMLASAIDANNVFKEILSSWDTIAITKQIDQKILTPDSAESGIDIQQERMDEIAEQLEDADKSYTLFNIPLKFVQQDIKTAGGYDLMEGVFDSVRRILMMSLLPQHLTPWSDSATTQGSEASMPPFMGRIKAKQNEIIKFFNDTIINELRKTYTWLADDLTYTFDEPKIMSTDYYVNFVTNLTREEIISKDAAKKYLVRMGIVDEDMVDEKIIANVDDDNDIEKFKGKESVKQANVKFQTFKKRLVDKKIFKQSDMSNWKEIHVRNVGGKNARVIETPQDYLLFEGLKLISTHDKEVTKKQTIKNIFNDYVQYLIELQDKFETGETEEDILIKTAEDELKLLLDRKLKQVFKLLDKNKVKTESMSEDFLNLKVLPKIDDLFKGFNTDMTSLIGNVLNKLNINIIKDNADTNIDMDKKTKDFINKKKDVMKKSIQSQLKQTKDKMLVDIKSKISNGIASGQDASKIKQDIESDFNYENGVGWKFQRAFNSNLRNSNTILRLKKWQKQGFDDFEWISRDDKLVRPTHAKKNRRIFNIQESLDDTNNWDAYPGKAANCRCSASPY